MSANKIDGSSLYRQQALQQLHRRNSDEVQRHKNEQVSDGHDPDTNTVGSGEKIEISERARQLQDLRAAMEAGRQALTHEPQIREQRVAQARRHLQVGVYQTAEAREATAERLTGVLKRLQRLLE